MKRLSILVFSILVGALFVACENSSTGINSEAAGTAESGVRGHFGEGLPLEEEFEFEITLENMAPATGAGASQPLSPPVFAAHTPLFHIFRLGQYASDELAQIAEDAVSGPMVEMLEQSDYVYQVGQGDGIVFPESATTFNLKTRIGFHRFSLVSMLVNTNDAFVGADAIRLPKHGSKVYYLRAYDAGSEKNTELKDHIPGPCCGNPLVRVPTEERIRFHSGIRGVGDLDPDMYGWDEPVVKLTITMIN